MCSRLLQSEWRLELMGLAMGVGSRPPSLTVQRAWGSGLLGSMPAGWPHSSSERLRTCEQQCGERRSQSAPGARRGSYAGRRGRKLRLPREAGCFGEEAPRESTSAMHGCHATDGGPLLCSQAGALSRWAMPMGCRPSDAGGCERGPSSHSVAGVAGT